MIFACQGKFGFEGGARSSVSAKFVEAVADLNVLDISCGYGHVCFVVNASTPEGAVKLAAFPVLEAPAAASASASSKAAGVVAGEGAGKGKGKKRGGDEPAEGTKKKGKGK